MSSVELVLVYPLKSGFGGLDIAPSGRISRLFISRACAGSRSTVADVGLTSAIGVVLPFVVGLLPLKDFWLVVEEFLDDVVKFWA